MYVRNVVKPVAAATAKATSRRRQKRVYWNRSQKKQSHGKNGTQKYNLSNVACFVSVDIGESILEDECKGIQEAIKPISVKTNKKKKRKDIRIRIDGEWYDCTYWAAVHPGGARFLEFFHGRDATNAFYALHSFGANGSDEAVRRLNRLPKCEAPCEDDHINVIPDVCLPFDEFRRALAEAGWFRRNWLQEALSLINVFGLCSLGSIIAYSFHNAVATAAATALIGLGMQQAGWLGHDFIHGRGDWCNFWRMLGGLINGHSSYWWTQKHSMHHTFTNDEEKDEDIMMEPMFFLRLPSESGRCDSFVRRWQHIYGYFMYFLTFASWRFDSIRSIIHRRDFREATVIFLNYCWLFTLPPVVSIGSILISGFLVGSIVTATHQSEEIFIDKSYEFVEQQFRTTRDAESENCIIQYLWGGMDFQLEHHLMPTMPRYNYEKLRPVLKLWAAEHGYTYKISPSFEIIKDNYTTLRKAAQ